MVLQKLLSFGGGSRPPSRSAGRMHGGFPAEVLHAEHAAGGSDDDTAGGGTYASDGGIVENGILRRNAKRNTERSVSWSETFDTYEERRDDEAWQGRRKGRQDDAQQCQNEEDALRDDALVLPSVSLSEDCGGAIEMEHQPAPPSMLGAPRPTGRKQLQSLPPPPPPPPPPVTMEPPRQPQERKQLMDQMDFRNLACLSAVSEGTAEMMRDRYGGLGGAEEVEHNCNIARAASADGPAGPAAVFHPRELAFPVHVDISHTYSGSTLGSLSVEDLALDDDVVNEYAARGAVTNADSMASFDDQPSWDPTIRHAASDDESLVTLSRKEHDYDPQFRRQHRADATAGHIGLILPFFQKRLLEFENTVLNPLAIESGSGTMFESWDLGALQNDLLNSGTATTFATAARSKGRSASTSFSRSASGSTEEGVEGAETRSLASSAGEMSQCSIDEGGDGVVYSHSSATRDDCGIRMDPSGDYTDVVSRSEDATEGTPNDERARVSSESLMDRESASTASSSPPEEEEDASVGSDDSTEVNSAQLSDDGSDDELSPPGMTPPGEVIPIQDLDLRSYQSKKEKKKKAKTKKKKMKRQGSLDPGCNVEDGVSNMPQIVVTDPGSVWSEDVSMDTQRVSRFSQGSKKKLSWGLRKKRAATKREDAHAQNSGRSSTFFHNIFHPRPLPPGRVHEGDDNDSIAGASQASSCVTTESILGELKLIEDTAKMVYNQYINSPEVHDNTTAIFSPNATELVLSEDNEAPGQGQHAQTADAATKKEGKMKQLILRLKGKKETGVSVTWTPKE